MANITLLPSAKVPLIYEGDNTMTTEWYRFFWNIYGFTGTGVVPVDHGGTGLDAIGDHQVIIGNSNNVFEPAIFTGNGINISYSPGVINLAIGASGVTPGTYGSASQVGVFTVNQYGNITAASNTSIGIDASQIISGTLSVLRGGTGQSTYTDGQLLIGNTTGNTLTKATLTAGTGISVTNGAGSITIANTGVLSVSGTAPVVSSGGATPAISMAAANTTTNGYLTSTDWNTFNNKAPATSGTSILYGNGSGGFSNVTIGSGISFAGGTLSATGSGGTVTSVAALTLGTTGTDLSSTVANSTTTPVITLNVPTASAANRGALSAADWSTFNSKQAALVSGTNLKTVGGVSLLGSGDVGTIGVAYGGTGLTTLATGRIPYGNGTGAFSSSATIVTDGTNVAIGPTAPVGANRLLEVGTSSRAATYIRVVSQTAGFVTTEYLASGFDSCTMGINNTGSVAGAGIPTGTAGIATAANTPITFATQGLERARIDLAGNTYLKTGALWQYAPAPTAKAAAATLTAAELLTGIISTTGATYTVTLPTGAAIDTGFPGATMTSVGFDFFVVNTASGTITIAVGASGMTSLGTLTVLTGISAHFRLRRTAANTYVLYRIG